MKTTVTLGALLFMMIPGWPGPALGQETKTKVLVVTGGHGFNQPAFFKMFQDNAEIAFTTAEHAKSGATVFERDDLARYDVLVLYDMVRHITEKQKAALLTQLDRGVGLVVLHHALVSYPEWPEYERIIGGRYTEPDPDKPGTVTEQVGWQHDVEVPVVIVARDHPVTKGLNDFVIHDEIYWGYRVRPDVTPLLTTTHPKSGKPLAWAQTYRKSRVVYLQLGHGPEAYEHPNYRRLLAQSIRWTARK
ncbi:MAG: ThuA domain-containing protein [Verrucomicrobiae bacterium]|nr:ThuA domain-containing protein [Verrucomicrobiae bacterium]